MIYRKEEEKAREGFNHNWDQKDPEWVNLFEEFQRIMQKQHIKEVTAEETRDNAAKIHEIIVQINDLNEKNERIAQAFNGDEKYARSYKKVVYDTTGQKGNFFHFSYSSFSLFLILCVFQKEQLQLWYTID